eukprot:79280-Pyramimonas_sp.AAC.1
MRVRTKVTDLRGERPALAHPSSIATNVFTSGCTPATLILSSSVNTFTLSTSGSLRANARLVLLQHTVHRMIRGDAIGPQL